MDGARGAPSEILGFEHLDLTQCGGDECKRKWAQIRDQLRKTINKRKAASVQLSVPIRKYKYEDLLDFLVPHLAERETVSSASYLAECEEELDEPDLIKDVKEENFYVEQESMQRGNREEEPEIKNQGILIESLGSLIESLGNSSQSPHSSSVGLHPAFKSDMSVKYPPLKRKITHCETRTKYQESPASQLMALILSEKDAENSAKRAAIDGSETDPVDIFLASIAHSLKSLNPILLNQAKSRVFSIVQDFEMKQLMAQQSTYIEPRNLPPNSPASSGSSTTHPSPLELQSNHHLE